MSFKPRYDWVIESAHEVLACHGVNSAPVNIEQIIRNENIYIFENKELIGISGASLINNGNRIIVINNQEFPTRRRFTMAHELGHLILHQDRIFNFDENDVSVFYRNEDSSKGEYVREIEANLFAAALLMPENLIVEEIQDANLEESPLDEDNIDGFAKKFDVSVQAMTIRLTKLGYLDNKYF